MTPQSWRDGLAPWFDNSKTYPTGITPEDLRAMHIWSGVSVAIIIAAVVIVIALRGGQG